MAHLTGRLARARWLVTCAAGIPCDPTRESTVVTLLGSHEQFAEHIVDLDSADAAAKRVTAFTKQLGDCTPYGPEGLTFEVLSTTPMKGADAGVVYRVTYPPYDADVVANESVGRSVISMSVVVSGDDLSDLSAPRRDFALALDRMRHPKPASPTDISKPLPPEPSPPAWPQSAGLWPRRA